MERAIITISENGTISIPSGEIWMSEMELVELFGVIAPTLRAAIRAIYKNGGLCTTSTQRYNSVSLTSRPTFYNLEAIIALAFRLNTYEANKLELMVLEILRQHIEKPSCLLIPLLNNYINEPYSSRTKTETMYVISNDSKLSC